MSAAGRERLRRAARWGAVAIGLALTGIGIRFAIAPGAASRAFGTGNDATGWGLHMAVALRDVWLGVLAVVLGVLGEWRALAYWFGLGTGVCLADSMLAAWAGGGLWPVAFHLGAGLLFAVLSHAAWRLAQRSTDPAVSRSDLR